GKGGGGGWQFSPEERLSVIRPAAAPVFLNFRSEVVQPVCFAAVYWDGPGDTLFSFEDQEAFKR
ncbi:hypothetical protein, partial [Sinorhizobium meliloti]|uniref:hypothetical protein n=1 Tax=Rhizobium meliloti TaxID=382 RepID=UPI001AECEA26